MNLKLLKQNFFEVFSNIKFSLFGIFVFLNIGFIFYYFTNFGLIKGNFGINFLILQIILQILISFLFAIFFPVSIYKYIKYSNFSIKENTSSFVGTFIGVLVAGCPACSISIASYIGLASFVSFLPFYGVELKIIAVILLLISNNFILKNLNTCKISKNKI